MRILMKKIFIMSVGVAFTAVSCTKIIRNPDHQETEQRTASNSNQASSDDNSDQIQISQSSPSESSKGQSSTDQSDRAKEIATRVSDQLHFDSNSAKLDPNIVGGLKELASVLSKDPALKIQIAGHTDSTGTDKINHPLSVKRAQVVEQVLIQNGVPVEKISVQGLASNRPVADNTTPEGRSENRRAEIVIS